MADRVEEAYDYQVLSASANVMPMSGTFFGFDVASYSAGATVAVYDSATTGTSTPILPAKQIDRIGLWPSAIAVSAGAYVVITGTITLTTLTKRANKY